MSPTPAHQQQPEPLLASRLSFSLPTSPAAATQARWAIANAPEMLRRCLDGDGLLLLTELVNNAVIHGSTGHADGVSVDVLESNGGVRVEVRDRGAGFMWRRPPEEPGRATGYGLVLVDAVADRWGIDSSTGRTCVWFELW